jgi:hypothetical protein
MKAARMLGKTVSTMSPPANCSMCQMAAPLGSAGPTRMEATSALVS